MYASVYLVLLLLMLCGYSQGNRVSSSKSVDDYMDVCIDSSLSKAKPGPESNLFGKCSPYKNHSCCTEEVANSLHVNDTWYKFNWDHCGQLSPQCRKHFQRDLCFYECTPNGGPWLVQDKRKWRNEKYHNIPLCASDCQAWFDDCKDDQTCVVNWGKDFSWKNGNQSCPKGDDGKPVPCKSFKEIYNDYKHFCEEIWDYSWMVVDDSEPCMKLRFNDYDISKNQQVAYQRAIQLVNGDKQSSTPDPNSATLPASLTLWFLFVIAAIGCWTN